MQFFYFFLIIVAVGGAIGFLLHVKRCGGEDAVAQPTVCSRNDGEMLPQYEGLPDFLSAAERSFFGVLQQAVSSDFVIFAKVRLADIVRPRKNRSRSARQSALNRICGKHVDFVLCDPARLTVLLVIELDDRSHGTLEAGFRDNLVDSAVADAGLPVLRVPARHSYSPLQLRNQINTHVDRSADIPAAVRGRDITPAHDDSRYMPKN